MVLVSVDVLTKHLKAHDRELYARQIETGTVCVFRKGYKLFDFEFEGDTYRSLQRDDTLVCSLTDTWGLQGKAIPWGIEPVLAHIKAIDLFNRDDIFDELMKNNEKVRESKERAFRNNTESFLLDFRDAFKKDFADIRVSNMDMSKDPRRKYEKRRLNHGIS
jgi:hypothetical protein